MQNKGFVSVFSILLALVCIFYLSFSFVTRKYNEQAAEYANGDTSKESFYLDSLASKKVWLWYTLKQCREKEVSLGLDLKGGMNVILELNVADVIRSISGNNRDENFNAALDAAYVRQATSQRDFVDLFIEEYKRLDPGARLSAIFGTLELRDKINQQSTDGQVATVLREELKSAVDNSFNVLRTRIDRFGVVSPNIQRLETDGRILIEMPGVTELERVRRLLQGSANLEFWETHEVSTILSRLETADGVLSNLLKKTETTTADSATVATTELTASADTPASEVDSLLAQVTGETSTNTNENLSADEFAKLHPLFARLQLSMDEARRLLPGPVVGYALKNDMDTISKYLDMPQVKAVLGRDLMFKWGVKPFDEEGRLYQLFAIKISNRDGLPALGGDVITNAVADFSQQQIGRSEPQVSMTMNAEGAKNWARLTKANIGGCVAIILDDMVYSAPRVNEEIPGGRSQISGNFTTEEAKDLANVLKSGKMAASVNIVQEDVVGPSLGQEAIQAGVISFILALILLMAYMCSIYGFLPGMIANGALILNIFFTMGVLASINAVLTLPGIAGMVLTLGMAVDANVLVYERVKEELRAGKALPKAISDGYSNAFSAIFDANLTTIITGVVLFVVGTGPIQGFATTMIIGLIASFLTAVFLTRILYEYLLSKDKLKNLAFTTSISKNILTNPRINFLGQRRIGYLLPIILIVLGGISMATIGLNTGIDFTGGRNYVVRFSDAVSTEEVRAALDPQLDGSVSVITIGRADQVRISTNYKYNDNDPSVDSEITGKLYAGLQPFLDEGTTVAQFEESYVKSSQKVGASMADDIKSRAVTAVILSMIFMALYILIRFRDFAFSVGVFVSVLATTLCIIAFYTLLWPVLPFSMEVDQTFIAAILTVIGYSINDTVVVFDRIRETIRNYPKRDRYQVINDALNSTLTRTFSTSLSTLLVVFVIFLLGGATIRSFTFAILLGVIIGTYSTLYVATPIAYEIQKRKFLKRGIAVEVAKA
ncbi:MAG: protein translocase subunit SecDF [Tannerella sp.]|jgi:SecD/SecF fusion protein|nr:protein translocase subunit SecDF [Tannerella sp.]